MASNFTVTVKPTFRSLSQRFAKADQALLDIRREELRDLGRRMLPILKDEAPKKTGKFAQSILYRTSQAGSELSLKFYHAEPLGTWIVGGTKPHDIPKPARPPGKPLAFFWKKMGKFIVVFGVKHPGTKPNDYTGRAYAKSQGDISMTVRKISSRYSMFLAGKTSTP